VSGEVVIGGGTLEPVGGGAGTRGSLGAACAEAKRPSSAPGSAGLAAPATPSLASFAFCSATRSAGPLSTLVVLPSKLMRNFGTSDSVSPTAALASAADGDATATGWNGLPDDSTVSHPERPRSPSVAIVALRMPASGADHIPPGWSDFRPAATSTDATAARAWGFRPTSSASGSSPT
jgi:hypothetical protein